MLRYGPLSGYDIKGIADRSVRFFHRLSYGQIYPTLHRLQELGLAELSEVSHTHRTRKTYSLTPAGRDALAQWIRLPTEPTAFRDEMLAKIMLAGELDPEAALELVRARREEIREELDVIESNRRKAADEGRQLDAYSEIAIDYGVTSSHAALEWCDLAEARLRAVIDQL